MNLWELLATQKLLEMQPVRPQLKRLLLLQWLAPLVH
jgi:hypothetical protein